MFSDRFDAARCPLCGELNHCALTEGQSTCWCFDVHLPKSIIQQVPVEIRGHVCICRRCAEGKQPRINQFKQFNQVLKDRLKS
ncbi:MAG: cysteine-rich CWC family protein [Spirochaetota bacterium]